MKITSHDNVIEIDKDNLNKIYLQQKEYISKELEKYEKSDDMRSFLYFLTSLHSISRDLINEMIVEEGLGKVMALIKEGNK